VWKEIIHLMRTNPHSITKRANFLKTTSYHSYMKRLWTTVEGCHYDPRKAKSHVNQVI